MRTRPCSTVILSAALMFLALLTTPARAELKSTAHGFGAMGQGQQTCVVCHAPHSINAADLGWSPTSRLRNFHWGDATETSTGTRLPSNISTWTGSTKVCLACHDGTIDVRSFAVGGRQEHVFGSGGDLKGTHPVAIPYPYNRMKNTYNGITTADEALKSGWVAAPRDVKLYTDPSGPAPHNRGMECATCHDPHGTANGKLLRVSMLRGDLCLRCHQK